MENFAFWIVTVFAAITIYRLLSRRPVGPKARVTALLRRYQNLQKDGLPEQECLFRILTTRSVWKNFPHSFLSEIVSRLETKEDVFRFVSLCEGYRYERTHLPEIAKIENLDIAMSESASLLANFGNRLQGQGRLKEAEFVQRLALGLDPKKYFTNLPLAVTYYKLERHSEAEPLFKKGLLQFEKFEKEAKLIEQKSVAEKCFGPDVNLKELAASYRNMYNACLKATRGLEKQGQTSVSR